MSEPWIDNLAPYVPLLAKALESALKPAAMDQLAKALLTTSDPVPGLLTAPPDADTIAKLRSADVDFGKMLVDHSGARASLDQEKEQARLKDIENARRTRDANTVNIAYAILAGFIGIAVFSLGVAAYVTINASQSSFTPVVVGLVGTVLGYVAGYAQQVVGFFFGSSLGSA